MNVAGARGKSGESTAYRCYALMKHREDEDGGGFGQEEKKRRKYCLAVLCTAECWWDEDWHVDKEQRKHCLVSLGIADLC